MIKDIIKEYVIAAHRYYIEADQPSLMSDYDWDMLARRIRGEWDTLESPYKKYLDKDCLSSANHLPWKEMGFSHE